jgi:hypothetical protein
MSVSVIWCAASRMHARVTVRVKGRKKTETRKVKEAVAGSLEMPNEFVGQNGAVIQASVPNPIETRAKRLGSRSGSIGFSGFALTASFYPALGTQSIVPQLACWIPGFAGCRVENLVACEGSLLTLGSGSAWICLSR